MRTVLIAIGLAACAAALTGCGLWDRLTAPPKPQTVVCRCAPALRGARDVATEGTAQRAPVRRYARHHHYRHHYRHYAGSNAYRWKKRYAERSVDVYNYTSHARHSGAYGYARGEGYGYRYGYGYHGHYGHGWHIPRRDHHYGSTTRVWADGYGRRHIYDESAVRHYIYAAHQRARQLPERLDPWHGYNDDWD